MGRRKKNRGQYIEKILRQRHRYCLWKMGITATSMSDIAEAAGYSKATLYVYFENKEEIIGLLVLESMQKLYGYIVAALEEQQTTRARYDMICKGLIQYQEEFPFYFKMVLDKINVDFKDHDYLPEEKATYHVGEEINEKMKEFLVAGIQNGDLREDLKIMPTIFQFWGMLAGLIQLAANKEEYIKMSMDLSKSEFLEDGFGMLYHSIENIQ